MPCGKANELRCDPLLCLDRLSRRPARRRNPTLERRCSVKGEEPQVEAALRYQIFEHFARPPKIERAVRLVLGDADRAVLRIIELCSITILPVLSRTTIAMGQLFFIASASAAAITFLAASRAIGGP